MSSDTYDIAFCDTCIGGCTVASCLARPGGGLNGFYLADYAVNPLGVKRETEVRAALNRWVDTARGRSGTLLVACNTASVRLQESPEVVSRAVSQGVRVYSMVDLVDRLLLNEARYLRGRRVCVMGTDFTVSRALYAERLKTAGAAEVVPLPAPRTEQVVAHMRHTTPEGMRVIRDEVGTRLADVDAVLLACTCFPLIGNLLRAITPGIRLLDPGPEVRGLPLRPEREGPNRLTLALAGDAFRPEQLESRAPDLFPGWDRVEIVRYEAADGKSGVAALN